MLSKFKIDSFQIRIPLSECVLDEFSPIHVLPEMILIEKETGAIDTTQKIRRKNFDYGCGGDEEREILNAYPDRYLIPMKFSRGRVVTKQLLSKLDGKYHPIHEDCLLIGINSKCLKQRYFEGITNETINLVYQHIMACGVAKFSYESFLKGVVTDIDICADYSPQLFNPNSLKKTIQKSIKISHGIGKDVCKTYNKKGNKGFQIGTREKSSIQKPFLKIYHKYLQMKNSYETTNNGLWYRNLQFAQMYLGGIERIPKHLTRLEFNLKNEKVMQHFLYGDGEVDLFVNAKHPSKINTLESLLNVTHEQWEMVMVKIWSKWVEVEKIATPIELRDAYSPKEIWERIMIGWLIQKWSQNGIPRTPQLAEFDAFQLYQFAMETTGEKEHRSTIWKRKTNQIPQIVNFALKSMKQDNDLSTKIQNQLLRLETMNEELHLLNDMKFPLSQIDWLIHDEISKVGRLGLYEQLHESESMN
jgi:hypothetical protein